MHARAVHGTRRELRGAAMGLCTRESFNKYFAVFILTAINLLNYMDRYTLAGGRGRVGVAWRAWCSCLPGPLQAS